MYHFLRIFLVSLEKVGKENESEERRGVAKNCIEEAEKEGKRRLKGRR
jgi:hypothetical protein